jgi:hypothetical protein
MSRVDWLLGIIVFLLLLVIVAIGLFFWQQSTLDLAVTPVSVGNANAEVAPIVTRSAPEVSGQPALVSFGRAHGRAQSWAPDASLMTASATWPLITDVDTLREGKANWNFVFFSPDTSTAVSANVVDEQVSVGDPYPITQPVNPLQISGWQIDSDQAIGIFLVNGGEAFLREQTDVSLTSQLSTVSGGTRMEWLFSAFANRNGETFTIVIDASTGDVVETR